MLEHEEMTEGSMPEPGEAAPIDPALAPMFARQYKEAKAHARVGFERARKARRFYDGEQWEADELEVLRKQGRPAIVINQIFKAINNISGKQRDARLDYKAFPLGRDDVLAADLATRGLRHLEDANEMRYQESEVFLDACKGPKGWAEIRYDDSDPNAEEIQFVYVDPFEVLLDPETRLKDLSDARYLIRLREVDLDVAEEEYPDHRDALRAAAKQRQEDEAQEMLGDYGNMDDGKTHFGFEGEFGEKGRERVLLREHHYWKSEPAVFVQMPNGDKIDAEKLDEGQASSLFLQGGQIREGRKRCYYVAIVAGSTVLSAEKSDMPFARFPYAALWGFRDSKRRSFGIIEMMIWPQKELNVARSRANESARSRWALVRQGAMPPGTLDQLRINLSKANFVQEVPDPTAIQMGDDKADTSFYLNLQETARREVDEVAGQNEAAYGDKSNEKSGAAINARARQQSLNLGELFDNWRLFRLQCGQMMLALALQRWSPEKWARIAEVSSLREHQEVIQKAAMLGQDPGVDLSWIPRSVASINSFLRLDIKLDDQAETTSERQAAMEQATQLVGLLPDVAKAAMAPDIIRMSDFPGAEEMAAKAEQAMAPPPMAPQGPPMEPTQAPMPGSEMPPGF